MIFCRGIVSMPPEKSNIIQIRFFGVAERFRDIKRADMTSKTGENPRFGGNTMTLVLFVIAVIFYFFKALISGCK